ncbi:MAG TPA: hypothetical protein VLM40_16245 [Gemmata sp.]|nr:hypothetical protein [Gemmata sp.]
MSMPAYPVMCYAAGCPNRAAYKVAARWSDGITAELKTYYLTCPECLARLYTSAIAKRAACRLAPGESLETVGIYELSPATRDRQLKRRNDLEKA